MNQSLLSARFVCVASVMTISLGVHSGLAAQQPAKRVKYAVSCKTCQVEFTEVATIGRRSDPARISIVSGLDRDSQGRFFAFSDDSQLLVYDAKGNFLKAIGRRGDGPGEFSTRPGFPPPNFAVGAGDTIFVFHPPKITLFSPRLEYVRTITMSHAAQLNTVYPLADGSWMVSADIRTPENIGRSIHVLDRRGSIIRSLGPQQPVGPDFPRFVAGGFHLSPDERYLWFSTGQFLMQQWNIGGTPIGRFEFFDVPYLPQPRYVTQQIRGKAVSIRVGTGSVSISGIDTLGRIWLIGRPPPPARAGEFPGSVDPFSSDLGGTLEIVDPRNSQILLSQEVSMPVGLLRNGTLAVTGKLSGDGHISVTFSSYRFVGR